jgi:hypothetical protein
MSPQVMDSVTIAGITKGLIMSNTDKLLLICIVGMLFGFGVALYDVSKRSYEKGLREGYHRGRNIKGQE